MEKIGSLLAEIADSRNPIVREQVARYRDSLVQNLVNERLRDFRDGSQPGNLMLRTSCFAN